ncbi:hypothetical protein LCGC14_1795140 [marine sediment metagenome]|uniref:Uncharacterized protein n=1 Tax=marine sediment metagenome TaxID=412755 RepID=A0A0F9HDZ9_9ZZZZ
MVALPTDKERADQILDQLESACTLLANNFPELGMRLSQVRFNISRLAAEGTLPTDVAGAMLKEFTNMILKFRIILQDGTVDEN